jgi:hypothetical protein
MRATKKTPETTRHHMTLTCLFATTSIGAPCKSACCANARNSSSVGRDKESVSAWYARQGQARQGKARQGQARQGKARQVIFERSGVLMFDTNGKASHI